MDDRAKRVGYLPVPGYRRLLSIGWVAVDIVPLSVSMEHAAGRFQLADQCLPLHISNFTGRLRAVAGAGGRS